MLEEIERSQQLSELQSLVLANVYYRLGKWDNCQQQMRIACQRFPKSAVLRQAYVNMLLERGGPAEIKTADEYLRDLTQLAPQDATTFQLYAKYLIKTGRKENVSQLITSRLANYTDPQKIDDSGARMLDLYASLLVDLGDLDRAEQVYRLLARRDPNRVFDVASFIGIHRDVAKCFEMLSQEYNSANAQSVLRVAIDVVRKRRDEVGDKYDAQVNEWLDRALSENIGSVPLLMAQAEFREVQENYVAATKLYRELLANHEVTGIPRAVVLNNLSFLLALKGQTAASGDLDPLDLVQEAAQILGPTADILDTRGVVWIARKRYDEAIADLSLAVSDNPNPSKYFHKAEAHLLAGAKNGLAQNKAALEAWAKAEELGLSRDSLHELERNRYDDLKAKIEQLRTGGRAVTRAEAAPVR